MPIKFDTFDINNIVMSLWQAISSNTHRLENYIKYCLVDSNRGMHPNFRQVKIGGGGGGGVHYKTNKIQFFKPVMFNRFTQVQENKLKSQGISI